MKLIDCFIFYNELNLLNFRFAELYDSIDYFIIVEATRTFVGKKKELFYENNKHLFSQYSDKIIHVIVDDMPDSNNPWVLERHQRRCIERGLKTLHLDPNDIIIISDADEIPDTNTVKQIMNSVESSNTSNTFIYNLIQDLYYYNITCKCNDIWKASLIINHSTYNDKYNRDPQEVRDAIVHNQLSSIEKGGWHFSYFGGVDFIKNKIQNFSHQECNNKNNLNEENMLEKIKNCKDLYGRNNVKFTYINVSDNKYLPKNYKLLMN